VPEPKSHELRQRTRDEVERDLHDGLEALGHLKLQLATRQLDDPLRVRHARRQVARLRTILREDALGLRPLAGATRREEAESPPETVEG
jgi:large subunit ribosomal protein L29